MTAAGKITASRVQTGDRVLVKVYDRSNEADHATLDFRGKDRALGIAWTKTGAGVTVARVLFVEALQVTGGRRDRRVYNIHTTEGVLEHNAPAQTLILAPEDAAGIKRAHAEAMILNATYDAYPVAEATPAEAAPVDSWPAERAADHAARVAAGEHGISPDAQTIVDDLLAEAAPEDAISLLTLAEDASHPECEAKGCDIPEGVTECRRCGAELDPFGPELTEAEATEAVRELEEEAAQDAAEYQVSPRCCTNDHSRPLRASRDHAEARAVRDHLDSARLDLGISLGMGHATAQTLQEARTAAVALSAYQKRMAELEDPARVERISESLTRVVRDPEARVVEGDVVRIHRGTRLYEVIRVESDQARDATVEDSAWEETTMARLVPCDPEDTREPGWVNVDLLHRVPPVARVRTVMIGENEELADDVLAVSGTGWERSRGIFRRPGMVSAPGSRPPLAVLIPTDGEPLEYPVGCIRIGDAVVINDRCFTVRWDGGPAEPHLEPTRWRDR